MSLICGIFSRSDPHLASAEALQAMLAVTRHRAKDGYETFGDPVAGIALAYCHTATFGQRKDTPSWHEDDGVVAAVDGEIYDAASHSLGGQPSIASPHAGAVVASFETDATTFPGRLDGVFSFFLWDRRQATLHICTDPMGHKLVYYYQSADQSLFVFSTELKAVLAHPAVPRQLDETVLPLYLSLGLATAPFTLAKGIRKLRAAECLSLAPGNTKAKRYWRPTLETGPDDFDYWVSRSRDEFVQAVRRSVSGAQKVGVHLSGGLDSSNVLAALKESEVSDIQAFTFAFKDHRSEYDLAWAERVARATETPQQVVLVDPEAEVTPELLALLLRQLDEPFDSAARVVNEFFLGQALSQAGINSALTGAAPSASMGLVRELRAADDSFESLTLEESLEAAFSRRRRMNEERVNVALRQAPDWTILRDASLANREVVQGLDQAQAIILERRLRSATSRDCLFYQSTPPLLGLEERTPFLDTDMGLVITSMPPVFRGLESPQFNRAPFSEFSWPSLNVDFRQREERGYPGVPMPSWLRKALADILRPLADDGIVTEEYLGWLDKSVQQHRKRAINEAWMWLILSCWYQFQIKQNDPLASVA